jgi:ribosomal protein S18 acetylase RimI-like enzyme
VTVERLSLAEIGHLRDIAPTPDPTPWAHEAERFVLGVELPGFVRRYKDDLAIYVVRQETKVVAVGVVYPDPRFQARRIGSIVVDHRQRGRGVGSAILHELVSISVNEGATVCWVVHTSNEAMLSCSRKIQPQPDEALVEDSYVMFVAP